MDHFVISDNGIDVYLSPTSSTHFCVIPFGAFIICEETDGEWSRISCPVEGFFKKLSLQSITRVCVGGAVEAGQWRYRIISTDGAYIRSGSSLSQRHIATLSYGDIVISECRLLTKEELYRHKIACGWISEFFNPQSGLAGPIIEMIPPICPILYKVINPDGCVVRSGVELNSDSVQTLPHFGQFIGFCHQYSTLPSTCHIPRVEVVEIAYDMITHTLSVMSKGWVSMVMNSKARQPIIEIIGEALICDNMTDIEQDVCQHHHQVAVSVQHPRYNGWYWRWGRDLLLESKKTILPVAVAVSSPLVTSPKAASVASPSSTSTSTSQQDLIIKTTSKFSAQVLQQMQKEEEDEDENRMCMICFSNPRDVTCVHGDTGHICYCFDCGSEQMKLHNPCPVCRKPVEKIIRHYWA